MFLVFVVAALNFLEKVAAENVTAEEVAAKKVACESVINHNWDFSFEPVMTMTCYMTATTLIDSSDYTISSDRNESIAALDFYGNKNILYLPINVDENFPELIAYDANFCAVKEISKKNFKGLSKLTHLHLTNNQIETISGDVFEDLIELEYLKLGKKSFDL